MAKTSKKKPLGRGLSSLLGENLNVDNLTNSNTKNNLSIIPIDFLSAGSWQVRKNFDESELHSLSQSIKNNGIFQPIVVVSDKEENGKYKIVAGERRWRAAQLANIHEVPIILRDDLSSDKIVEISLLENLERSDLNPIEEAKGYEELINKYNYTQEKVAKIFSKSRPYITNFLRLLSLPDEIKSFIVDGKISVGHARAIINSDNSLEVAKNIIKKGLSVREVEKLLKKPKKSVNASELHKYIDIENELSNKIGLKTKILFNKEKKNGSLTIKFKNLDQLEYIMKKFN
jgi:ParB family chromosome partitioning protein